MKKINLIVCISIALLMSCASLTTHFVDESGRFVVQNSSFVGYIAKDREKTDTKELLNINIGDTIIYTARLNHIHFGKPQTHSYLIKIADKEYFVDGENVKVIESYDSDNPSSAGGSSYDYKTGKRGGQYYINSKGNKTYKKK